MLTDSVVPAKGMLIRINGCSDQEEWCILEFQGDLVGNISPNVDIGSIAIEVCVIIAILGIIMIRVK